MYMCVCVCVYVCVYACVCMRVCVCVWVCAVHTNYTRTVRYNRFGITERLWKTNNLVNLYKKNNKKQKTTTTTTTQIGKVSPITIMLVASTFNYLLRLHCRVHPQLIHLQGGMADIWPVQQKCTRHLVCARMSYHTRLHYQIFPPLNCN